MTAPRRRLKVTVNGRTYWVEAGDLNARPLVVVVDGREYQVQVEDDTSPASAEADGERPASVTLPAAPPPASPLVTAPARPPAPSASVPAAGYVVRAPMPGNIVDIAVREGDTVSAGQKLCALEAMKMKSALQTARAGTVIAVHVQNGQPVTYREPLFTLE